MKCTPVQIGNPREMGWYRHRCLHCGREYPPSPTPPHATCTASEPSTAHHRAHVLACPSRLAVVTCFFDPHHSEVRLANYHRFIRGMAKERIEVYTVEGVLPGESPLLASQPRHTALEVCPGIWHKERLINLGIAALPAEIDAVGWFDCDVTFSGHRNCAQRRGLDGAILRALGRWPVIQPWLVAEFLDADGKHVPWTGEKGGRWSYSMGFKNSPKRKPNADPSWAHPGFAWAARRDTLQQIGGLFDLHPLGGGDTLMACGFYGIENSGFLKQYSRTMLDAWRPWARRATAAVGGSVGYVEANLSHLWHGSIASRQYGNRNRELSAIGCDPSRHLVDADNGTLTWAPDTPAEIVAYCDRYFAQRETWDSTPSEPTKRTMP